MGVRYSFDNFSTKGHGVIEYADPHYYEDGQKPKRRTKSKSKFATRWPGPAPMKFKTSKSKAESKLLLNQQAQKIFKKRYPGQKPQKGQIKEIMRELQAKPQKQNSKKLKTNSIPSPKVKKPNSKQKIDELALSVFKRRFPGQKPQPGQLDQIRQEVINARNKLGL